MQIWDELITMDLHELITKMQIWHELITTDLHELITILFLKIYGTRA